MVQTSEFLEAGLRGKEEGRLNWSLGWFRAENHNDILFVASTQTSKGSSGEAKKRYNQR
jgi:hypothetical protein